MGVTEMARCDNCGVTRDVELVAHWFAVEGFGIRCVSRAPGPWHLCSAACLSEWAGDLPRQP